MKLYDVTALRCEYVKPETDLTAWGAAHKPFALCNASLYDGGVQTARRPSGPPVGTVIEEKKLVRQEGDYPGLGIKGGKLDFGRPFTEAWDYFLAGYNCPVVDGRWNPPAWRDDYVFGTKAGRIGVAYMADRRVCILTDDGVTLRGFADHAIRRGALILVNLDGGGSRHLLYDGQLVYQSPRIPYNALAFYKDAAGAVGRDDPGAPPADDLGAPPADDPGTPPACPYPVPTRNLLWGSRGEDVKWLQWQLNKRGFRCGAVDGVFGAHTWQAAYNYQKTWSLRPDGICGKQTRGYLLGDL